MKTSRHAPSRSMALNFWRSESGYRHCADTDGSSSHRLRPQRSFQFHPPPTTPLPEKAAAFAGALANTGYMLQLIGATQLIVGLLLYEDLLRRWVMVATP